MTVHKIQSRHDGQTWRNGQTWRHGYYRSQNDLRLYYRDYGDPASEATPLLCLTGLTRNSADFHDFAQRYAARRRVICPDYRGRGRSAYDPDDANYQPPTYARDALDLLTALGIPRAIFIGTSLGGLVSMATAAILPTAIAGVVLNDVGPEIDPEGRKRIGSYVGVDVRHSNYAAAADALKAQFARAYRDKGDDFWMGMAERTFTPDPARGDLRLDYDLALANPLRRDADKALPDLWPYFRALAPFPVMVLRGLLSDVLSAETLTRMKRELPSLLSVEIPNRGHVPILDEPEAIAALEAFLHRIP